MRARLLIALAGCALAGLALAGCATPAPGGADPGGSVADAAPAWPVGAGWLDGGRTIALVTWGSSSWLLAIVGWFTDKVDSSRSHRGLARLNQP